jgi:hypothetical protein
LKCFYPFLLNKDNIKKTATKIEMLSWWLFGMWEGQVKLLSPYLN